MPLTIYRRHNPQKCSSRDSQHCSNKRRPCPIWVRGSKTDGTYIREPLKYRDWTKAQDVLREMEVTGKLPKVSPAAEDRRTTIETWRDRFLENARTENISEETLRKYRLLFKQLLAFAQEKGVRFVAELDLPTLQDFRTTWKDKPLSKSKKQERLRSVFKFAAAHKWIEENPALQLGKIKVERTQQVPFSTDEMEAILAAAREVGPEVYTFILTMRFSGLRISDVSTLRIDSLQGDHLILRTEKTGTPVKGVVAQGRSQCASHYSKRKLRVLLLERPIEACVHHRLLALSPHQGCVQQSQDQERTPSSLPAHVRR